MKRRLTSDERLNEIRSVIKETERQMDKLQCDQLPLLREAFMEIIRFVGPQGNAKYRRTTDVRREERGSSK